MQRRRTIAGDTADPPELRQPGIGDNKLRTVQGLSQKQYDREKSNAVFTEGVSHLTILG